MQPVKLVISLLPNGQVKVEGPIANRLVCYGMLAMAQDALRDYKPEAIEVPDTTQAKGLLLKH